MMSDKAMVEFIAEAQRQHNLANSAYTDLISTAAGRSLMRWSSAIRSTWWYRLFSRVDVFYKRKLKKSAHNN